MSIISVVVPIYNADKYLNQCIDSIRNQKLEDIEIILVDDGSTDESGRICEYHAVHDLRIRVIHQKIRECLRPDIQGRLQQQGNIFLLWMPMTGSIRKHIVCFCLRWERV